MKHAKNTNEPDSILTKVEVDDNGNVISKKYAAVKRSDKDTEAKLRTNISRKAGDFTITEKWGRKVPLHKAKAMEKRRPAGRLFFVLIDISVRAI